MVLFFYGRATACSSLPTGTRDAARTAGAGVARALLSFGSGSRRHCPTGDFCKKILHAAAAREGIFQIGDVSELVCSLVPVDRYLRVMKRELENITSAEVLPWNEVSNFFDVREILRVRASNKHMTNPAFYGWCAPLLFFLMKSKV